MIFLFIIDPIETLILKKDTSFILMVAAQARKHDVYVSYVQDITSINFDIQFYARKIFCDKNCIKIQSTTILNAKEIDCVFIRKEPPVHHSYIIMTWMLDFLPLTTFCINSPHTLRNFNEKIIIRNFPTLIPQTLITSNKQIYLQFLKEHNKVILKPVDGFGGSNIFLLSLDDPNKNVVFEQLSKNMKQPVIIQKFIPESTQGDKRILLLNGEILGAVLRKNPTSEHRNNFALGAQAESIKLTQRDLEIVNLLSKWLKKEKLHFVGIDIIGSYLIEINITSPGCLQEIMSFNKKDSHKDVIRFCENQIEKLKKNIHKIRDHL